MVHPGFMYRAERLHGDTDRSTVVPAVLRRRPFEPYRNTLASDWTR